MRLELGRILSRAFFLTRRHRWLWILGVVGGGGARLSANYGLGGRGPATDPGGTSFSALRAQARALIDQDLWLVFVVGALVLVVTVLVFLIYCVAVPASIWGTLVLDSGREVGLGEAWRYGRTRFQDFVRLGLIRIAAGLPLLLLLGLAVFNFVHAFLSGSSGEVFASIALLVGLAVVAVLYSIALGAVLVWSERTMVVLNLGPVDAIRSGWWLTRHSLGDTVLIAIVMAAVSTGISIIAGVAVVICALPGGLLLGIGMFGNVPALAVLGGVVIAILVIPVGLVATGYLGSVVQAGYALAGRDLCISHGLAVVPELLPVGGV